MGATQRQTLVARAACGLIAACAIAAPAHAQASDPGTRTAVIEQAQAEKAAQSHPYVSNRAEKYLDYAETYLGTSPAWYPYFQSAYSGGGFTVGAGRKMFVGSYNTFDVRGSITPSGYKRLESEFVVPRLFHRQGVLSVVGGWREATQVGFYGVGNASSPESRASYGFAQPYGVGHAAPSACPSSCRPSCQRRSVPMATAAGRRRRPLGGNPLHARHVAGTRRACLIPPFAGHGRVSTVAPPVATRGAAVSPA